MASTFDVTDFDGPDDDDELKTKTRRLFMYSPAAIAAAAQVERVHVLFPEFQRALTAFDRIYQLAGELETPQGALVLGPPGTSKTTVAQYFVKSLPQNSLFDIGLGAVCIRLRPNPSQGLIVALLLRALKYPFTEVRKSRVYTMRDIAFEALRQKGTRVVFVDQGHCLATQGRPRHTDVAESSATDTLNEMMDATKVGLVIMADEHFRGLKSVDAALDDRISVNLPMSHFAEGEVWRAFLLGFANKVTVVDLSWITSDSGAAATHAATGGNRRSFRRLITEAVLVAIDAESPRVNSSHLHTAFARTRGDGSLKANPYAA